MPNSEISSMTDVRWPMAGLRILKKNNKRNLSDDGRLPFYIVVSKREAGHLSSVISHR